jgi:membrane associated rhomboid family serine protease
VYVSMAAPVIYAFTRLAWALGFPLGMTEEYLRAGQESGIWIAGLSLAIFGLLGACLTLGLTQRWGEVFPRWMFGLAGRRVPIALAVVPASLVSVLLIVGGISIWSGLPQMAANAAAAGAEGIALLFPVWGAALAVATLGYYYRRRGACKVCGRGGFTANGEQSERRRLSHD